MKKKSFIALLLLVFLGLTSCVKNDTPDDFDPNLTNDENVLEHYSFGQGFSDDNITEFVYDGNPLVIPYEYKNDATEFNTGIVVFINGIIQKYSTDDSNEEKYVHIFHVPEENQVTINLYVQPNTGNKGDTLNIHIGSIFKADEIIASRASYGHQHNLSQIIGFPIIYQHDSTNSSAFNFLSPNTERKMTDEEKKSYEIVDEATQTTTNALDNGSVIEVIQDGQIIVDTIDLDQEITLRFAGKDASYKGYIFLDSQLDTDVPVLDIQIKKDTYSEFTLKIDKKDYKNFYVILAPTDINEYLYQSQKFIKGESK